MHPLAPKVAHFPAIQDVRGTWRTPVAADGKGFPDLLLVRDRVIAVECKGEKEPVRREQEAWLTAFRLATPGAPDPQVQPSDPALAVR